jgi:hypothetical protein
MKPKKQPERVRIGHRYYRVSFQSPVLAEDGSPLNGLCDFEQSVIYVDELLTDDVKAEIFTHEVLHALHWEAGLTDESSEEAFTNLTAKSLCRFYQDNPGAHKWVLSLLKAPR